VVLSWTQTDIGDVAQFSVTRSGDGQDKTTQATSTALDDLNVQAGINYCYTVTAIDAAGNSSAASAQACATVSVQSSIPVMTPDQTAPNFPLADCGSISSTNTTFSGDIDQPGLFDVGTIVTGQVDPNSELNQANFWNVPVIAGGYHLVIDSTRVDGRRSNIGMIVNVLDEFGVEQSRVIRGNEISSRNRAHAFLTFSADTTLRVQIETNFAAENYVLGLFANGTSVPSPYFTDCPSIANLSLNMPLVVELDTMDQVGGEQFLRVDAAPANYRLILDAVRADGLRSNIIYSIETRDQVGQAARGSRIVNVNDIGTTNRSTALVDTTDLGEHWLRFDNRNDALSIEVQMLEE